MLIGRVRCTACGQTHTLLQPELGPNKRYRLSVLEQVCTAVEEVGWAMGERIRTELVLEAVNMATRTRRPEPGTIHHSDHDAQYTALGFGQRLREAGLVGSMGTVGDCYDNALMESFWATLQSELLDRQPWPYRTLLRSEIFSFIEGFYNRHRLHSSLGMITPEEFERRWFATATDHQSRAS